MRLIPFALASLGLTVAPVWANDDQTAFVESNILAIFYHELGHAIIDVMEVPIFGQEEDAADVAAVMLIDALFEEDAAQSIAYDSAFGYLNDPEGTQEVAYWDLHGPDEQRYYNHVCLFYGGNPDEREDLAQDLGLPEERADTCPEEFDMAAASWGAIFDEMTGEGAPMRFEAGRGAIAARIEAVLAPEITALNADFSLPEELLVRVEDCGEANAFYDPSDVSVTMCTEFVPHLEEMFDLLWAD